MFSLVFLSFFFVYPFYFLSDIIALISTRPYVCRIRTLILFVAKNLPVEIELLLLLIKYYRLILTD